MTDETTTHPRILLTHDGSGGLRTVQDLSAAIQRPGISQQIWQGFKGSCRTIFTSVIRQQLTEMWNPILRSIIEEPQTLTVLDAKCI